LSGVDNRIARVGGLTYLEVPATDLRRSAAFYEAVLGWRVEWRAEDDARFEDATAHLIGRFVTGRPAARDGGFLPHVFVEDVDEAVSRALAHGGEVVTPPRAEGDLRLAKVRDPAGNALGLWHG
jgi:hypothetical protein